MRLIALTLAVLFALILAPANSSAEPLNPSQARQEDKTLWYDIRLLGLEGQGWTQTKAPFDRLPAKAEGVVRAPVWSLSQHSAGLCVRFVTDSPDISARWTLTSDRMALTHMPATGVSGLDLYVRLDGGWRWLAVGQPRRGKTNTVALVSGLPPAKREYLLYLPLYNGVSSVELGIPEGKTISKAPPRTVKPVVFYGTSITQGGCASRTGMVHTAILGRWLDCGVINLGFSGNGKMEPEMADLLAELDPSVYVLDCLPNMNSSEVTERVPHFVRTLRKAHPETPIVLVEDRFYADGHLVAARLQRNEQNHAALKAVYEQLKSDGVAKVHYVPGETLLGADGDDTVDGSHPTDLGFFRQAQALRKTLEPLVNRARRSQ